MNIEKIKIKYQSLTQKISWKQKIVAIFCFIILISTIILICFWPKEDVSSYKKITEKAQEKEKDNTIDSNKKKIYMDFEDNEILFYKKGRVMKKVGLKKNVEIDECFVFSKELLEKIHNFEEDREAEILFSNISKEKEKKIKKDEGEYCVKGWYFERPEISAKSYLAVDIENGRKFIFKNLNEVYPIASVTKLMTSTILLEEVELDEMTKVSKSAYNVPTNGAGDLKIGEEIKVEDLIFPLLLESSNVAAEVIAEKKGRKNFLKLMNKKSDELGLWL